MFQILQVNIIESLVSQKYILYNLNKTQNINIGFEPKPCRGPFGAGVLRCVKKCELSGYSVGKCLRGQCVCENLHTQTQIWIQVYLSTIFWSDFFFCNVFLNSCIYIKTNYFKYFVSLINFEFIPNEAFEFIWFFSESTKAWEKKLTLINGFLIFLKHLLIQWLYIN